MTRRPPVYKKEKSAHKYSLLSYACAASEDTHTHKLPCDAVAKPQAKGQNSIGKCLNPAGL